ncbi:MAG TPA: TIGR03086 family metal-binding protein [Actinocatenispora sp.]
MIDFGPACRQMADLVAGVDDARLDAATPCTEYAVRDLVRHVDQVAQGFAVLARGGTGGEYDTRLVGDWPARVAAHVRAVGAAWDEPAAWRGESAVGGGLALANELWGRIAFTEIVVHGWDLAAATGQPFALPAESLRACLDHVTDFVPRAPVPQLWGPPVAVPDGAPLIDRIVAVTGRRPAWRMPEGGAA